MQAAGNMALGIVHVVDSLEYGGLERVVTDLAIEQKARGHDVRVFSILRTGGFIDALEEAGIPVTVGAKRRTMDLGVVRRLRELVLADGVHVVHAHNFVPNYYAAAATLFAARRPVLVNTCHNMGSRLAGRKLRWLYRGSLAATARIALVGEMVRDQLVGARIVPAGRATTVFNGIPVAKFEPDAARRARVREALGIAPDTVLLGCVGRLVALKNPRFLIEPMPARRARVREALGIAPDTVLLGCVGRLVALKNHRFLIEQMPALSRDCPDLALAVVGGGPLEDELRARVAELGLGGRVRILGARTDTDGLLSAMDVFVLPSETEGISIALLEACAAGLPVVATAVGGNPEIVDDGVTGRLYAAGDAGALGRILRELAGDAGERQRLGRAAQAWVAEHGSVAAMQCRYQALYLEAMAAA